MTDLRQPLVFVVDDDSALRHAMCLMLRSSGYQVKDFDRGEGCLAALQEAVPDCVLLDLHLGGMEYPEIMEGIKALGLQVPVVAVTGDARDSPDVARARAAGIVEVLTKPFRKAELQAVVRQHSVPADPSART